MTIASLQEMKREGKKIVAVVAWDAEMAKIAERAGIDLVSVGDSVGVNLWGQQEGEITLDEMLVVCKAVRRGVKRALLSCDLPRRFIGVEGAAVARVALEALAAYRDDVRAARHLRGQLPA